MFKLPLSIKKKNSSVLTNVNDLIFLVLIQSIYMYVNRVVDITKYSQSNVMVLLHNCLAGFDSPYIRALNKLQ